MKVILVDDEHLNLVRLQTEAKKALPEGTEILLMRIHWKLLKKVRINKSILLC